MECPVCEEKTRSVKGELMVQAAPHLAFHLHRFTLDMVTYTSKKVLDELRFPFWLWVDAKEGGEKGKAKEAIAAAGASSAGAEEASGGGGEAAENGDDGNGSEQERADEATGGEIEPSDEGKEETSGSDIENEKAAASDPGAPVDKSTDLFDFWKGLPLEYQPDADPRDLVSARRA